MSLWLNLFRRTRLEYFADFLITPAITLALLVVSLKNGSSWFWPLQFIVGVFAWTLYEYAIHRWVLHGVPFFKEVHALHHIQQKDYIAIHPLVTIAIYALMWLALGIGSSAITIGFSVAYIIYSILHTAFHYCEIGRENWLYGLRVNHSAHHRDRGCYGVTSPIWDIVFRTYRTPSHVD